MAISKYEKKVLKGLYREVILIKCKHRCLRCGKTETLQVSHIESVGRWKKLEYDTDNAIILCVGCHLYWWHKEPRAANKWLEQTLPKAQLDRLDLRKLSTGKGMYDYKVIKLVLENELNQYAKRNL